MNNRRHQRLKELENRAIEEKDKVSYIVISTLADMDKLVLPTKMSVIIADNWNLNQEAVNPVKPTKRQESAAQSQIQEDQRQAQSGSQTLDEPLITGEEFSRGIGLFPVPKRNLLLVAGLVWLVAGVNVLHIGFLAAVQGWRLGQILIAAVVFALFLVMFMRIVHKNRERIMSFRADGVGIFRFLDTKGYVMMILMMSLGIGLRYAGIIPLSWIQTFYTGLGTALTAAGIMFLYGYIKGMRNPLAE